MRNLLILIGDIKVSSVKLITNNAICNLTRLNRNPMKNYLLRLILIITAGVILSACGGGGDSSPTFTVGGTISGLTSGSLVLKNNGTETLTLSTNSTKFTFPAALANGAAYAVTVATQPSGLVCSVSNGSGTINGTNITNVSVSCAPHFAYALNYGDGVTNGNLSMYAINPVTGILESLSTPTIATGIGPQSLAINPAGTFAYVVNTGADSTTNGNVSMYSINSSTGALTPLATPTVAAGVQPQVIAINPAGTFAYVTNSGGASPGSISIYSINSITGVLTPLGSMPAEVSTSYITINPAGTFAYAVNFSGFYSISTYSVNPSTGALTNLNSDIALPGVAPQDPLSELTINPTGRFAYITNYAPNKNTLFIYSINPTTGILESLSTPSLSLSTPTRVTINPAGTFAYIVNNGSSSISMYSINATSGALTPIGSVSAGNGAQYLTINPSGTFAYVTNGGDNNISMYSIDKSTGILKPLSPATAPTGVSPSFIAITP